MFLHLQNAIHVTLYIIRRAFISLSSKKNVHNNVKSSLFDCPYCKHLPNDHAVQCWRKLFENHLIGLSQFFDRNTRELIHTTLG